MSQTTITRRSALRTGTLFLGAGALLGTTTAPVAAAPLPPALEPIDRAEAALLAICGILPELDERDLCNLSHNVDVLGRVCEGRPEHVGAFRADAALMIGPGNRLCDHMDADDAAERRVASTHAAVVARYAEVYRAGGVDAGTATRQELAEAHGPDLGAAIAAAAFKLYLHQEHHGDRDPATCCADA